MRWTVVLPGQPVSWDAAYKTGRMPVRRKGVQVYNDAGDPKFINRPVKTDVATTYQNGIQFIVQAARPSGWKPKGQIRLIVDMVLSHDMDDDNALKLARDAFARAIDHDDINFLVCTRSKEITNDPGLACLTITVDDDARHP